MSIFPIAEFQADVFSFAYRPRRSALMCINILYNCCARTQNFPYKKYFPIEVDENTYKKHSPKVRIGSRTLVSTFGSKQKKRRRAYKKKLYVLKTLKQNVKNFSLRKTFKFSKYLTIWNLDVQKCFDHINHQTVIQLTPLCDKYLFFLKQWLIAPIVGSLKKGSSKIISIKPKIGILQGGVICSGICNLVLDGIDDLMLKFRHGGALLSKCYVSRKAKSFLNKTSLFKFNTTNKYYPKTYINYLRYAGDIIFYGFHAKETFLRIKEEVHKFLVERSLLIKPSINNTFQFKQNSAFSFLGYRYIFLSIFNKQKLTNGRFTKKVYAPLNITEKRFRTHLRSRIFLIIDQGAYKIFKSRIRKIFKKGHFHMSVEHLISILNEKIRIFASYFSFSEQIRVQLNSLDNSIRK